MAAFLPLLAAALLGTAFLSGCAVKPLPPDLDVEDVRVLSQNPEDWVAPGQGDRELIAPAERSRLAEGYLTKFFAPWNATSPLYSASEIFWGIRAYEGKNAWGENTLRRDPSWFAGLVRLSAEADYPNTDMRAVMVRNSGMRVMPTLSPHFGNFSQPGLGYPFDNFQNSPVWAGTPVHVSHVSSDMAWALVETAFAGGWVPMSDLAWADDDFVAGYLTGAWAALTRDHLPMSGERGNVRFLGRIGSIFPLVDADGEALTLAIPVADENRRAVAKRCLVPASDAARFPAVATPSAIASVAARMAGQAYGWGGMYMNRDCSAMVRDLLAPFGIWLPKHSRAQLETGERISLAGLTPAQKDATILERGVPWLTLLGKPGHVMLYIGRSGDRPVVFHSLWGLKTVDSDGNEGRKIIGRAVITTLEPGKELSPWIKPDQTLINAITEMSVQGRGL